MIWLLIILNRNHGKTAFIRILGAEISGFLGSQITGFNEGLIDLKLGFSKITYNQLFQKSS